jgi:branched-chain amino acid transport system substrate-binding protein
MDDRSREFSKRYAARMGKPPSMMQAGVYSSVLNHIKSIQAANTKDPAAVVKDLQGRTFNDAFAKRQAARG